VFNALFGLLHWAQSHRLVARESLHAPQSLQHLVRSPAETYKVQTSGNFSDHEAIPFRALLARVTAAVAAALLKLAFRLLPLI